MNNIELNLKEKGLNAQRKTIEGIFEFANCMLELKESCETVQGGSNFSKKANEWWGISYSSCSYWTKIASDKKLFFIKNSLPNAISTLYQLTTLTDDEFEGIKEKVTKETKTSDIINYKNKKRRQKKEKKKETKTKTKNYTELMKGRTKEEEEESNKLLREKLKRDQSQRDKKRAGIVIPEMTEIEALRVFGLKNYPIDSLVLKFIYQGYSSIYHPDKGGDQEKMSKLNLAYKVLK